jgi:putative transposase
VIYRGFPSKLHHEIPGWVEPESLFHIRIALERNQPQTSLTDPLLAPALLQSAEFYDFKDRWHIALFLVMPDHIHAILAFPRSHSVSRVIGDWKHFHARKQRVCWQEGFFDHRLRADERGEQLQAKVDYIRQNPVAASLCATAEKWPWVIDKVIRLHP